MGSLATSLLILALAIIPALGWVVLYRYLDHRDPEPRHAVVFSLLTGVASTVPVFGLQYVFTNYPQYDLLSFFQSSLSTPMMFMGVFLIFVALVEEVCKGIAFISITQHYEKFFNQMVDGILYGAMVGIGFALAENAYYFSRALQTFDLSSSFFAIFAIRSFGTMLAHTLFTGILGFYFALAYFSPFVEENSKGEKL